MASRTNSSLGDRARDSLGVRVNGGTLEDGTGHKWPSNIDLARWEAEVLGDGEGDRCLRSQDALVRGGQGRESLDTEGWVGRWATLDEWGGQGVDLVKVKRNVVWGWERCLAS